MVHPETMCYEPLPKSAAAVLPNSALNVRRAIRLIDVVVGADPALSYHFARLSILQHTLCERFAQAVSCWLGLSGR